MVLSPILRVEDHVPVQAVRQRERQRERDRDSSLSLPFYSLHALSGFKDAHPYWGGQSAFVLYRFKCSFIWKYPHRHLQKWCIAKAWALVVQSSGHIFSHHIQQWDRPQGQGPSACPSLLLLQTSCPGLELVSQAAELQVEGRRNAMWNVAWSGESWLEWPRRFSVPSGSNPDSFRNYLTPQLLGKSICLLDTMFSFSSGVLQTCLLGIASSPLASANPLASPRILLHCALSLGTFL